jgi:hypothetical protein
VNGGHDDGLDATTEPRAVFATERRRSAETKRCAILPGNLLKRR